MLQTDLNGEKVLMLGECIGCEGNVRALVQPPQDYLYLLVEITRGPVDQCGRMKKVSYEDVVVCHSVTYQSAWKQFLASNKHAWCPEEHLKEN